MFYLLETFGTALKNLNRYKLRTLLTTAGIIFGIGAVVSMMSVGAGARASILAQIYKMGITNIIVNTVKPPEEKKATGQEQSYTNVYGLTFREADYLRTTLHRARMVLKVHRARKKIYCWNRIIDTKILGVEPEYFDALNIEIDAGRALKAPDCQNGRRVCVVGPGIIRETLYMGDPMKLSLRVGSDVFNVVGVTREEEQPSLGQISEGESLLVYIPFDTSVKRFGTYASTSRAGSRESSKVELERIVVSCWNVDQVIDTASVVSAVLKRFHEKRDYEIIVPLKQLQQVKKTQQIFRVVMVLIASISLLVGGIGIANIMFATVTERTREIGIRRALGARRRDILIQFLCETVLIALGGGLFGSAFGVLGVHLISKLTGWEASIQLNAMVLALVISCLVGIISGLAPARRAAHFDPVASLRHE
ncbi:MAG: ABC transporter permease [Planctomycetota bacterium]